MNVRASSSTPDLAARDRLKALLMDRAARDFAGVDIYVKNLEIGPPVGKPVQYRVSAPDADVARDAARNLAAVVAREPRLRDISMDWNEPARVVRVEIDQDQARRLGVTSQEVSDTLSALFSGLTVTQLRDDIFLIDVVGRGEADDRSSIDSISNLQMSLATGESVPLSSIVSLEYATEQPLIAQRNGLPTVTVKAAVSTRDQPATLVNALAPSVAEFQASLPPDVTITVGGTVWSTPSPRRWPSFRPACRRM
ncbi:efflux RND transporter permease subunit [Paracoccus actinidiae]|uniref:efflux RND transporter permease subunit n=1 Tax=Paracoccus actinidiae TaxID=3064531 RepID=UPI0027D2FCAC|nr:efflux RND transporter permease subunit [Paracoccus sp. M09]